MNRIVVGAVLLSTALVGCSPSVAVAPAPAATATTSSVPSASPLENWVSLVCVVQLKHTLDPALFQAPSIDADTLPEGKRRMRQWTTAVAATAGNMVAELGEVGPPPDGGELAKAFDEHRERYADLAEAADTAGALVDSARAKADLDLAVTLVQLPMLAATGLSTDPAFIELTRENPLCV